MVQPQFSIVLLTYNRQDLLESRLADLRLRFARRPEVQLVVFDNGSTDGTPLILWELRKQAMGDNWVVLAYHEKTNIGFGRGFNKAAGLATGKLLVLISDDVRIFGDFLGPIGDALEEKDALICQQVIDWKAGWNQFGDVVFPYPAGHILALRADTWKLMGGFDQRFAPAGYEDVDLGYRAKIGNLAMVALPKLPVAHESLAEPRYEHTVHMKAVFAEKWNLRNEPERP